ncbi:endoribonuclease L-PSP [Niastella yeongjuensis]|uniref:Endoribonuclease L-PSP n=1 Tax=Niastella yeongjuensis TaxID=354355 RepID=A0A1V9EVV0_9BACT|nr:RidA family protein [Niastella yeongjuensis]OQP50283.1 endoribonuclease L-PSP [Niastella yeongjuensis]SEN41224.1 Enamine deaminase RidA, house cleaning of reactive enamine intermediates, YjgF/YER057c/UK114 family [Niastella yeongjuensis]
MVNFKDISAGYSKYVEVDLGASKMVILSGQVAFDANGNTVGKDDFEQQAEHIFQSIKSIVEKAGGSMDNVIKLTNYVTDVANLPVFRKVRDKYINTAQPPASTTMEVSKFVKDDLLLEVEATAIISK